MQIAVMDLWHFAKWEFRNVNTCEAKIRINGSQRMNTHMHTNTHVKGVLSIVELS